MLFDDELSPEQAELLTLVWRCIPWASGLGQEPDWPVWDFVRRSLYQKFPSLASAESVLHSLPSVQRPWADALTRPYGLVWHSGDVPASPGRENHVGLTIAGLTVLARRGSNTSEIADGLAQVIAQAATTDEQQEPRPFEVVSTEFLLDRFLDWFTRPTRQRRYVFPGRLVAEAFRAGHEYPRMQLIDTANGHLAIELGSMSLRGYRDVSSAEDYLTRIEAEQATEVAPPHFSSPLTLIQTLDYLGYVVAADERFGWERLTMAPNLQSAAALGAQVQNRAQYESSLSSLWNVIDQLGVPPVPAEVVASEFSGEQPRSLRRLRYWVEERLDDDLAAQRAVDAISLIQKVGRLRAEPQHASASVAREAVGIRRALGLPDYVSDYQAAWDLIRDSKWRP